MIKLTFCLHRLPQLSREAFQAYWRGTHGPMVQSLVGPLRLRRYVQSHTRDYPALAGMAAGRGIATVDFDGVAELWWDSLQDLAAVGDTEEGRAAGRVLLEDEKRFIDLPRSPLFWAEEVVFVGA